MGLLDSEPLEDNFDSINDRLMSGGGRFFKWGEEPGIGIEGQIIDAEYRQARKFGTSEPDFWSDGKPKMELVLTLQTKLRDDADDDGARQVTLPYRVGKQLKQLLKAKGLRLAKGATYAQKWTSGRGTSTSPREYAIAYEPAPTAARSSEPAF